MFFKRQVDPKLYILHPNCPKRLYFCSLICPPFGFTIPSITALRTEFHLLTKVFRAEPHPRQQIVECHYAAKWDTVVVVVVVVVHLYCNHSCCCCCCFKLRHFQFLSVCVTRLWFLSRHPQRLQ